PHQHCFPHATDLVDDEFFAAFHLDAYRPDSSGGTERMGYAGGVPSGWMPGAPALVTPPYGHEPPPVQPHPLEPGAVFSGFKPTWTRETHGRKMERIRKYLEDGDIYQVNLTLPFHGNTAAPPEVLFDISLQQGGASYGMNFITPTGTILSLSPELYLRRRKDTIETRPIKGTREIPNRADGVHEARESLTTSEKDRAEHVMIVDLERNDLGRLCETGSITVAPLAEPVEHPTVLHLESRVRGRLRENVTTHDLFAATFPGGSISGAPKKRALEIIAELEESPRGIYCGAMGWIDCEGDCDLNLPIRTAVLRPDGTIQIHSGGGIVADSTVDSEWQEILHKLSYMERVLQRDQDART
ncbi:MAG: anthranilate synthase component I family protein, partial [Candidatus Sumerlaeia bacterium]|nr:anthranilate synthase component I family protein [Candidatus Sumerlaeia bacterium]